MTTRAGMSWGRGSRVILNMDRTGICCRLRGDMIASGIQPIDVGSAEWFPGDEWHPDTIIGQRQQDICLLLLAPHRRWQGSFSRLVTGIIRHRLTPVVVAPILDMPNILRRWGWESRTVGFGDSATEEYRPSLIWQAERVARS